jgi:hypothetical protein
VCERGRGGRGGRCSWLVNPQPLVEEAAPAESSLLLAHATIWSSGEKRTPLMQFGPFLFRLWRLLIQGNNFEEILTPSLVFRLPGRCLFVVSRETRHVTHTDSISHPQATHTCTLQLANQTISLNSHTDAAGAVCETSAANKSSLFFYSCHGQKNDIALSWIKVLHALSFESDGMPLQHRQTIWVQSAEISGLFYIWTLYLLYFRF